jgi:hypothetical protein
MRQSIEVWYDWLKDIHFMHPNFNKKLFKGHYIRITHKSLPLLINKLARIAFLDLSQHFVDDFCCKAIIIRFF